MLLEPELGFLLAENEIIKHQAYSIHNELKWQGDDYIIQRAPFTLSEVMHWVENRRQERQRDQQNDGEHRKVVNFHDLLVNSTHQFVHRQINTNIDDQCK